MTELTRKLEQYREQENLFRNEGSAGFRNLCRIARAIGYKDSMYRMQIDRYCSVGDLMEFFEDNPGAIEAVFEWIGKQNVEEWREELDTQLIDEDEEDNEEDEE